MPCLRKRENGRDWVEVESEGIEAVEVEVAGDGGGGAKERGFACVWMDAVGGELCCVCVCVCVCVRERERDCEVQSACGLGVEREDGCG